VVMAAKIESNLLFFLLMQQIFFLSKTNILWQNKAG
jgi:hypothetical protein